MTQADPLVAVISKAARSWYAQEVTKHVAAAVRAHIAAVLDAEEAKRLAQRQGARLEGLRDECVIRVKTVRNLRATLLGTEEP